MTARKPEIDYLVKDFESFRQLLFDQLSLHVPAWTERNPADLGVAIVEALAYAADRLSVYQDAVSTEAYLGSARLRASIRRHVRMLDYQVHEGCNARAWVRIAVEGPGPPAELRIPRGTQFLTVVENERLNPLVVRGSDMYREAISDGVLVFESMHEQVVATGIGDIDVLDAPAGSEAAARPTTRARLRDTCDPLAELREWIRGEPRPARTLDRLRRGVALLLEDRRDPGSFAQVVRVVQVVQPSLAELLQGAARREQVRETERFLFGLRARFEAGEPEEDVLASARDALSHELASLEGWAEVEWSVADALRGRHADARLVAHGNLILVDHGRTLEAVELAPVVPGRRYRPTLSVGELTYAERDLVDGDRTSSAANVLLQRPHRAKPSVWLSESTPGQSDLEDDAAPVVWESERSLLDSDRFSRHFAVERSENGEANLRFGFRRHGRRPRVGARFSAICRVGNGARGNVGAGAIAHLVVDGELSARISELSLRIRSVSNPIPAAGGIEPEDAERARLRAPHLQNFNRSGVTEADLLAEARRHPGTRDAAVEMKSMGGAKLAVVHVLCADDESAEEPYRDEIAAQLERVRPMGAEIAVRPPRVVPIGLRLSLFTLREDAIPGVRKRALEALTGASTSAVFHRSRARFGRLPESSELVDRLLSIAGVVRVDLEQYVRLDRADSRAAVLAASEIGSLAAKDVALDVRVAPERDGGRVEK